jgi:anti-anti-sigma factor
MTLEHQWQDDVLITRFIGELNTQAADELWEELGDAIEGKPRAMVLDFGPTTYIASLGIGLILRVNAETRARGIPLRLANVGSRVRMVLDTVNLGLFLPIDKTLERSLTELAVVHA